MDTDRDILADDAAERSRIAAATGFSEDAVKAIIDAVQSGSGSMAQFDHPELGGFGQWSAGGMLMIGDMFNTPLKARVAALADEVSRAHREGRFARQDEAAGRLPRGGHGWPASLGPSSSTGSQNGWRYAVFPEASRLAVERDGIVTVYATGEHRISGVSQQQGGATRLAFTSQHGVVDLADLSKVGQDGPAEAAGPSEAPAPARYAAGKEHGILPDDRSRPAGGQVGGPAPAPAGAARRESGDDTIGLLRRLAELRAEGILSEDEFSSKKAELLARL